MATGNSDSIWTRAFALLCLAQLLGYAQHAMLTPTFPLYITHLGGSPFVVGFILPCVTSTSVIASPIRGYSTDRTRDAGMRILCRSFVRASILSCFLLLF